MIVTRIPHPGNDMLTIDAESLSKLYQRLLAGETWKSLAALAGVTDTGLKRCLIRAGYEVEIRRLRKGEIGKTRNIVSARSYNSAALQFLSRPLI